ncbi:MAG: hypothetical protein HY078_01570 [Elusimicrobia bacterium]|nr:hypothetical protein [Elusimicrobiota bacterium]
MKTLALVAAAALAALPCLAETDADILSPSRPLEAAAAPATTQDTMSVHLAVVRETDPQGAPLVPAAYSRCDYYLGNVANESNPAFACIRLAAAGYKEADLDRRTGDCFGCR